MLRLFKNLTLGIVLFPTVAIIIEPYCSSLLASYLAPLTLIIVPLTIVNLLLWGILCLKDSFWKWSYGFFSIYSLYLLSYSFNAYSFNEGNIESEKIRLVSWNVDNFQLNRDTLRKSSELILAYTPDIICFQERPHDILVSWDSICSVYNYPYYLKNSREDEVLNLAVFSKWPLENLKETYFSNTYNKFFQVDICYPAGKIRLFNVHLQTTGANDFVEGNLYQVFQQNALFRNQQAEQLADSIEQSPYPVIVCGDFNDTPLSYAYHQIHEHLQDCFLTTGRGWGGSYQSLVNLFRIDYIFCSKELNALNFLLKSNNWSDHKIQYVEMSFQ